MPTTWNKITKATGTPWTKVAKPTNEITIVGGDPIGLLLALTYANKTIIVDGWKDVPKATGTPWTKVPKAN